MTSAAPIIERHRMTQIPPAIRFKEEVISLQEKATNALAQKPEPDREASVPNRTEFTAETISGQGLAEQTDMPQDKAGYTELYTGFKSLLAGREGLSVGTHREELDGYVKKITENRAYVVFETAGGPLERAVKLSKLEAIGAHRQGTLIRLVVEERGASTIATFENLEEKGIATWRDKIKDEDLEKYDLLKKSGSLRKPSNPR